MLIFHYIVIKFENSFVQCCDCGSFVFITTSATATIICIHSKTENYFSENESFLFHYVWISITSLL